MSGATTNRFETYVRDQAAAGRLVVQPRMGVSDPRQMRSGLQAVRDARATTAGTVTVDSYTRVNDHDAAREALRRGRPLNGFPLVAHGVQGTAELLHGLSGPSFPVQVRHGSARPHELFEVLAAAGADATEGGPVSYCLPYSRVPLREARREWERALAVARAADPPVHMETFGGCMLGQLCPPGLLVALSALEALFYLDNGITSISVSYAQQTHLEQDVAAVRALRRLAAELLPRDSWHTVVYTFMGVFPQTEIGAFGLLEDSVRLAVSGGAERLIVKTPAEAHRIPTFAENISALEFADAIAGFVDPSEARGDDPEPVYREARTIVEAVLRHADNVGDALVDAFHRGTLDIPYCLHADNANRARSAIDASGRLQWTTPGNMPVVPVGPTTPSRLTASQLLEMLDHNRDEFDRPALAGMPRRCAL